MREIIDRAVSALLTIAALVIAAVVVLRELRPQVQSIAEAPAAPRMVEKWDRVLASGRWIGDSSASIKVVEFGDIECPFCRQFHQTMRAMRAKYGKDIALLYVHLPLSSHRFAQPAARAVECAHDLGRFEELLDQFYAKQDSLGLKSWASFASDAGIDDTSAIQTCAINTAQAPMIETGIALAAALGINGTPTVLVNGWRFPSPPSIAELAAAADAILEGRSPFPMVAAQ